MDNEGFADALHRATFDIKASKTFFEKMDEFMEFFSTITKEESDYIEHVLKWDDEMVAAFFMAKRVFEEKE